MPETTPSTAAPERAAAASTGPRERLIGWRDALLFGVLTFVPLSFGAGGRLNADTMQFLYLDPAGLMRRAVDLWNPHMSGGSVSHQAIGYLWPMGPYFWLTDVAGIPAWLAHQWWVAGIQFLAALGVLALLRHLMPRHPAQLVAAGLYGLSPLVLGHVTGVSALLLPYAALGWLVLCVVRACEDGGWRWPAAFALIVTTAGSLNGSSLFFVMVGALLWVPFAVWGERTANLRAGFMVLVRLGVLTLVTQLWWMVAYGVGGTYGIGILSVTETVHTTNLTTSSIEILRGLGYWFFYGTDNIGPWLPDLGVPYIRVAMLAVSFAVPVIALALGGLARWGSRVYFAGLVLVGTVLAVGAFPEPLSPYGNAFEAASRSSDLVLSLRNTQRAAPLIILGLAAFVAAGGAALQRRYARTGAVVLVALAVLVVADIPAQWRSGLIADRFHRDEIPAAWYDAAADLDAGDGRLLELPGQDFASYRWGHTRDPVLPGLTDRDTSVRELVPTGGSAGASLLSALDTTLEEGTFEPSSVVPIARLLGITDIVVRNDIEYERYRTQRPARVWQWLTSPAARLGTPTVYGVPYVNEAVPARPMIDEVQLGIPLDVAPPEVGVLSVPDGGREIVSTHSAGGGVVVDGDGDGVVAAAAAGLLDGRDGPVLMEPELLTSGKYHKAISPSTRYVVTDTNRKRAQRWYSLRENVGATEPANALAVVNDDPSDARLELVPGLTADDQTVVEWRGAKWVWGSAYGNDLTLIPEERPAHAFDGDPRTAWRVDTGSPAGIGPRVGITLTEPSHADHLTLVEAQGRPGTRAVTHAHVVLDGTRTFDVIVDEAQALAPEGVQVALDGKPFHDVEVRILETSPDAGPAGFAEVSIPGVQVEEMIRLPKGVLDQLGTRQSSAPLALVLSRHRADPAEPVRADPETALHRTFTLDTPVSLSVQGTARVHANASEAIVDRALGLPDVAAGAWSARSSGHLAGSIDARADAAFDGDPTTAWTTPFVAITGQWVEVDAGHPVRLDAVDVSVVADEHHSTPRQLAVSMDGGTPVTVDLPAADPGPLGHTQQLRVPLPAPVTGQTLRVDVTGADPRITTDWYSQQPVALPVALADIAVPGLSPRVAPATIDTSCRTDVLTVDDQPVGVRLTGTPAAAIAGDGLDLVVCDGQPLQLGTGRHDVRTAPGADTGIDLDRLVLTTAAWDAPASSTGVSAGSLGDAPPVQLTSTGPAKSSGTIDASDTTPFWVVLDQSMNDGWHLDVEDATVEGPISFDSYANGWLVTPQHAGTLSFTAEWRPQRGIDIALLLSAAGVVLCCVLVLIGWRRARRTRREVPPLEAPVWVASGAVAPPTGSVRVAVVVGLATAVGAALVIHPLVALVAGPLGALAVRRPRIGRFLPTGLVILGAMQVGFFQARDHHPFNRAWPQWFGGAHITTYLGILLLGAGAVYEAWARLHPPADSGAGDRIDLTLEQLEDGAGGRVPREGAGVVGGGGAESGT